MRLLHLTLFVVFAIIAPLTAHADEKKPLNVLFIAVDDLRPELGCYGHRQILSPNIDKLAASGMLFERAYCQQAVCAPSRASLMTGCRPDSTKVTDLKTPLPTVRPDLLTLDHNFKEHGYTTISLGKIFHHAENDDSVGWSEPPWRPEHGEFPWFVLPENKMPTTGTEANPPKGKRGPPVEAADVDDDAYPDGQTATRAVEYLQKLKDADKPFFLAVGFVKPHLPFACPKKYWDLYDRNKIELPDDMRPPKDGPKVALTNWPELRQYRGMPKQGPLTDAQAKELVHGYYACVSQSDALVGKVLAELDRLGLRDNTIVILWGDHGWHLGEHSLWTKHTNFEIATHAPLMISGPGIKPNQRTSALVEFVDVYPSLCELTGLPLPKQLEGSSFVPLLSDPTRSWKTAAFSQFPHEGRMGRTVTDGRYRFTLWPAKGNAPEELELYDHQTDPQEDVNLAGHADQAETVKRMTALLTDGWRAAKPK
jgi:arylsulfatase A-like enzyme